MNRLSEKEQKKAAKEFSARWQGRGYEKGESNLFWIDLLTHIFGVDNIAEFIRFEDQVHLDHTSFIDGYIPSTHVMIEQKSLGKDLRKAHQLNDKAVMEAYGFWGKLNTESDCVTELMKMYQKLTAE